MGLGNSGEEIQNRCRAYFNDEYCSSLANPEKSAIFTPPSGLGEYGDGKELLFGFSITRVGAGIKEVVRVERSFFFVFLKDVP